MKAATKATIARLEEIMDRYERIRIDYFQRRRPDYETLTASNQDLGIVISALRDLSATHTDDVTLATLARMRKEHAADVESAFKEGYEKAATLAYVSQRNQMYEQCWQASDARKGLEESK